MANSQSVPEPMDREKKKLLAGEDVHGVVASPEIQDPELYQSLKAAGFDYVFVDLEHTPFSVKDAAGAIAACRTGGIAPWVRIPTPDRAFISRLLDAGATGLIVPRVETAEDVERVLAPAFFPPVGNRGFGGGRFRSFLPEGSIKEHMEWSNSGLVIVVQFERIAAVENARSILEIPEVTAGVVGPCDLSISCGVPGDYEAPAVEDAITQVVREGRTSSKPVGIIGPKDLSRKWKSKGMSLFCMAFLKDLLNRGGRNLLEEF